MSTVAAVAVVAATIALLGRLHARVRPEPYDWPVWVWRLRLAWHARHPDLPCQTQDTMRVRPTRNHPTHAGNRHLHSKHPNPQPWSTP